MPKPVRDKLDEIKKIKSYNDIKNFLGKRGIELRTDSEGIKGREDDKNIGVVADAGQKLATAIMTFETVFGKNSLSASKKVSLYDNTQNVGQAAFYFNAIGDKKDPDAGTIKFKNWSTSGHNFYHELTHVYQQSMAGKNEDAIIFSNKIWKKKKYAIYFCL